MRILNFANRLAHYLDWKIYSHRALCGGGLLDAVDDYIAPNFCWQKYRHVYSPYFLKWGLRVPMCEAEYFGAVNGIKSDRYITKGLAHRFIYPYLNDFRFCEAYHDKAMMRFVPMTAAKCTMRVPRTVVECSGGLYYDGSRRMIDGHEANLLLRSEQDVIVKPSIGSSGGAGVHRIIPAECSVDAAELSCRYHGNFLVQERVRQHPYMAAFNESSFNTVRMVTKRVEQGRIKVLYAVLRYGGSGSFIDNACSGGGFVALDDYGRLLDRKMYQNGSMQVKQLPDSLRGGGGALCQNPRSCVLYARGNAEI